jgi:hypothetical protein
MVVAEKERKKPKKLRASPQKTLWESIMATFRHLEGDVGGSAM